MSLLNTQLRNGYETARDLGLSAATYTVETTTTTCPTHSQPVMREQAYSVQGWFEALSCPASDGTCAFDAGTSVCRPIDGDNPYQDEN